MGDTTLATFRVDKETWKEFKEWASERGSNASTELNQFILRSLGRIDGNLDKNIDSIDNRIDEDIDKRIESYLDSNLDERIEETVKRYLDDNLEQQMYEATLKSIDINIDKSIDTNPDQNIDNDIDNNLDSETETSLDTNIDGSLDEAQSIDKDIDKSIDKEPTTLDEETRVTESIGEEEVIEQLADEKGLSGKELALLLGVRSEYLTRWKSGKNIPKEDSENYQVYQDFCKYRWEKKKGSNQPKYYQIKN